MTLDDFYWAINHVAPSLIRVEADEATYNLHIIVRFELEQALLSGDLPSATCRPPGAKNISKYLGIEPPNDADGCLQDIHWSAGLIGYFPTYSLGNLYASQFFEQADRDLGGLAAQFARGEFQPLKALAQRKDPPPRPVLHRRRAGPARHRQAALARAADAALGTKLGPLYGL